MKIVTFDPAVYKLVPVEPTTPMCESSLEEAKFQFGHGITIDSAVHLHRAMLAAAPDDLPGVVTHSGEPVEAILLSDCDEGHHRKYGSGLFSTNDCVTMLYDHPAPDALAIIAATLDAAAESVMRGPFGGTRSGDADSIRAIDPQSILDRMNP